MWFFVVVIIFKSGNAHYFVNKEPYYNVQQCEGKRDEILGYVATHVTPKPTAIIPGCIRVPGLRKS